MLLAHSEEMLGRKCFEDCSLKELVIEELSSCRILFREKESISEKRKVLMHFILLTGVNYGELLI